MTISNHSITKEQTMSLGTFLTLYIAQFVPSTFLMTALQVTMREGNYSLATIGLLNLVRLPWLIKFLWSPLIDRHCITTKDYKHTIFSCEIVYALALLFTGFFDVKSEVTQVIILVFISMLASATQDIATDALAILSFRKQDHSLLNSMQSMGSFGGTIIGSGLLLIVLHEYGWQVVVPCLSLFVLLMLLPLLFNKNIHVKEKQPRERAKLADFIWFFTQRKIWKQIGFLLLYYMGIIGIISTIRPYLVDMGYSMKEIGFLTGIIGTSASFVSAWLSGWIVRRMGIEKARILMAFLILLAPSYFLALSFFDFHKVAFLIGIIYIQVCYGLATVVVYTSAMGCVRPGREGTDFTVQIVITHVSGMLIAVAAGSIGEIFGYRGIYITETIIALFSLIYVLKVLGKTDKTQPL